MTINESRLDFGKFTLGETGTEFEAACQINAITLEFDYNEDGDPFIALCGDELPVQITEAAKFTFTALQDYDIMEGLVNYSWDHALEVVPFSWQPSKKSPVYTGKVQVKKLNIGGDVRKRLTSDAEWNVVGAVTRTPPTPVPTPVITAEEDTTDATKKTAKVTVTSGGPAMVTFGDAGHTEDDGEVADGANKSHKYTGTGEMTITATSKADPSKKTEKKVTIPFS